MKVILLKKRQTIEGIQNIGDEITIADVEGKRMIEKGIAKAPEIKIKKEK